MSVDTAHSGRAARSVVTDYGLLAGLALVCVLPSWTTLGAAQVTVIRLASLAAAATLVGSRRGRTRPTDWALAAFLIVVLLGWLLQYREPGAGRTVSIELTPLGFYLGARALPKERIRALLVALVFAGAAGGLTVIFEYLQGHVVYLDPNIYKWNASTAFIFRPGGIFGSPPGAGAVLCATILLGLPCHRWARGGLKVAITACQLVATLALFLTFTRAPMIALGVGLLLYLWLVRSPLLRPLPVLGFAIAATLALALALPAVENSSAFQKGIERQGSLTTREGFWSIAWPVATSSPHTFIFGVGTASLEAPGLVPTTRVPQILAESPQVIADSLHNQYLTILLENGLLGLVPFAAFLLLPFGHGARHARRGRDAVAAGATASVLAMGIVMTVGTTVLHGPTFAMLLTSAALAAGAGTSAEENQPNER